MSQISSVKPDFHPVILGADIGSYSLARSFHEEWGIKPTVVAKMTLGAIANSAILDLKLPQDHSEQLSTIDLLLQHTPQIQAEHPDQKLLLIANSDSKIWAILNRREELDKHYLFAIPDQKTVAQTNDKGHFAELAAEHGMTTPPTLEVNLDQGVEEIMNKIAENGHPYPLVLKPCYAYDYELLKWAGKRKVYIVENATEMRHYLGTLKKHTEGIESARRFVIQPKVEGNDTYNLSITAYVDQNCKITMLGSAHVLLEDHSPTGLGNPNAMITEPYPALYKQVESFLTGLKWHGFANFDVKIDRNSGKAYFFEINPRIGRNSYYNTLSGLNPMKALVADLVTNTEPDHKYMTHSALYTVIPKFLLRRYVDKKILHQIQSLKKHTGNPLWNANEIDFSIRACKRLSYLLLHALNHCRKYQQNYPLSTLQAQGKESFSTKSLLEQ